MKTHQANLPEHAARQKRLDVHNEQLALRYQGKSVLVTGGFGFIGGQVARRLVELGANVSVIDIDTREERSSIINDPALGLRTEIHSHQGSVADFDFMKSVCATRFDFVFNMAAYASTVEKAVEEPLSTFQANSLGVVVLMEALRATDNMPDMFFHASTDKVYGELNGEAYDEEDPLLAEGLYDTAKLAADVFTRSYHSVFKVPTVILRMCNIFGPYDMNIGSRLLPKSLHSIFGETPPRAPTLYTGSQGHSRDYLYIDDLVSSVLLMTAEPTCAGRAFNSVSCTHKTTPEMLQALFDHALIEAKLFDPERASLVEANGIQRQAAVKSDQVITITRQHLNSHRLVSVIGFEPQVSLQEGLQRTANFYRNYFDGVREAVAAGIETDRPGKSFRPAERVASA